MQLASSSIENAIDRLEAVACCSLSRAREKRNDLDRGILHQRQGRIECGCALADRDLGMQDKEKRKRTGSTIGLSRVADSVDGGLILTIFCLGYCVGVDIFSCGAFGRVRSAEVECWLTCTVHQVIGARYQWERSRLNGNLSHLTNAFII